MPTLAWSLSMLAVVVFLLAALALILGAAVLLVRRPSDKKLVALALVACLAALVFVPLLRLAPEAGLYLFLAGFYPVMALILVAVLASALQLFRTRRWPAVPGLLLSLAAASLMVVNLTTPWLWPYAKY